MRKHRSAKKEAVKKANVDRLQSENDRKVRVKDMKAGGGSSRPTVDDIYRDGDTSLTNDVPLSALSTIGATIMEAVPTVDGSLIDDGILSTQVCSRSLVFHC